MLYALLKASQTWTDKTCSQGNGVGKISEVVAMVIINILKMVNIFAFWYRPCNFHALPPLSEE